MSDDTGARPVGAVPLDPSVRRLWRIRAFLISLPIGLVVVLALVGAAISGSSIVATVATGLVLAALATGVVAVVTQVAWKAWRFEVGDEVLVLRHGVWRRIESWVPYHRVQHIDLEAGPIERRLGLTGLVVRTASAATDGRVPGLHPDEASRLRRIILDRAGRGDAV